MSDERFDRLDEKLEKVADRLGSIDVTLAKNTVSLIEHVKRTNILEKKLAPVEKHVFYVQGGLKLIGLLSVMTGIAVGVVQLFLSIKH